MQFPKDVSQKRRYGEPHLDAVSDESLWWSPLCGLCSWIPLLVLDVTLETGNPQTINDKTNDKPQAGHASTEDLPRKDFVPLDSLIWVCPFGATPQKGGCPVGFPENKATQTGQVGSLGGGLV